MLDYDYIKIFNKLIAADLSRQKNRSWSKAIQQIEFVVQFKNPNDKIVPNESMFVLMISENKIRLNFSQGSVTVL